MHLLIEGEYGLQRSSETFSEIRIASGMRFSTPSYRLLSHEYVGRSC